MTETIRVLIVDDHAIVRSGLCTVIEHVPDMEVVGEAGDGVAAVEMARTTKPDVILMDLVMPRMDGLQAIVQITRDNPKARILVLTSYDDDGSVLPAIRSGAAGYLMKDISPQQLVTAIRDVHAGRSSLAPGIAAKVIRELKPAPPAAASAATGAESLTERELAVLRLVGRGLTNLEIAQELCISERTANSHVSNILHKLQLANRTRAALYAIHEGLVDIDSGFEGDARGRPARTLKDE